MRKLLIGSIFLSLQVACTDDPKPVNNGKDSLADSVNVLNGNNDTFQIDSGTNAGTYYNCAVLNRKVPNDTNQNQIRIDLAQLLHCGIDSFDFLYVVPNLFPGWVSENKITGNKNITYADFVKHVNEFKITDAYFQLHLRVQTLDSLRTVRFDITKLNSMKPTLGKLGFTQPEWEMFSGFARTYPIPKKKVFTWGDMMEAFDKYKPN